MTRTTGATESQIEAAIERLPKGGHLKWCAERYELIQAATALCNTDHRIVRVDDLRALAHVLELFAPEYTTNEQAAIDRIQALIGEAE